MVHALPLMGEHHIRFNMQERIAVMIGYRDRPTELALLLNSLMNQTYNNFDIFISDDCSGTPITAYHFLQCIFSKLNERGNFVKYSRNEFNLGVSKNRQKLVDWVRKDGDYKYMARVDDDVILEPDYFDRLLEVLGKGYDLATGVTPFMGQPQFKRESKFIKPIGNKVILDSVGNFIFNGDDFGMEYYNEAVIPIHHFRSCALYKTEIHDKVSYENKLTKHGFREEEILSFKIILAGYTMAVDTKAIAWHLLTPSGGERFAESNQMIQMNEFELKEFTKECVAKHGDFLGQYNKKLGIGPLPIVQEELIKPTNLSHI